MTTTAPQLNLVARDFESFRRVLEGYIKVKFPDDWKDFQSTGVARAMLDVVAYAHAQRTFYYDRLALNAFIPTADQIEAMKALCRGIGYKMRPATSASVPVRLYPVTPQLAPITVVKGTRVSIPNLTFEAPEDLVIPAGRTIYPEDSDGVIYALIEGETIAVTFTSDGSAMQQFDLGRGSVIDGSIEVRVDGALWEEVPSIALSEGDQRGRDVYVGSGADFQTYTLTLLYAVIGLEDEDRPAVIVNGVVWTQVADFTGGPREYKLSQNPDGTTYLMFGESGDGAAPLNGELIDIAYVLAGSQRRYEVTFDAEDRPTITFGDGVSGVIPPNTAEINVTFRIGGGVKGNVVRNAIDTTVNGQLPNGALIPVRIRNYEAGSGGELPETVDHAAVFAPLFAKALNRAVTQEDWSALAETFRHPLFGAPAHARARLAQRSPERNLIKVAVWSRDIDGNLSGASSALKASIKKFLDTKRIITTYIEMEDGVVIFFDLNISVIILDGFTADTVFSAMQEQVRAYFNSARVLPGKDLALSLLYDRLQDVDGVESLVIEAVQGSVKQTLNLGDADGIAASFDFDLVVPDGSEVAPFSVKAIAGAQTAIDDGVGGFAGDATGTIDYVNGRGTVTFNAVPPALTPITVEGRTYFYAAFTETLPVEDGTTTQVNLQTQFFPVRKRRPVGRASGSYAYVANYLRVAATNEFHGFLTPNITANTLEIIVPVTATLPFGLQVLAYIKVTNTVGNILDGEAYDSAGVLIPATLAAGIGSIVPGTGEVTFDITNVLNLLLLITPLAVFTVGRPIQVSYLSRTIVIQMPEDMLPLTPGRLYFIGGKDPVLYGPAFPAGFTGQLEAYDDGEGNIVGDVVGVGSVNYDTGQIEFTWNADPPADGVPPDPTLQTLYLHFNTVDTPIDGVRQQFRFVVTSSPIPPLNFDAPGENLLNVSLAGANVQGRIQFPFHLLSTSGLVFADAFDNAQGLIDGETVDSEGDNNIIYNSGQGNVKFLYPPALGTPATYQIHCTSVVWTLFAGLVWFVKAPGAPGHLNYAYADNEGILHGTVGTAYPASRLDHDVGKLVFDLSNPPIDTGRTPALTYDAALRSDSADIPIAADQIAALGKAQIDERPQEVNV